MQGVNESLQDLYVVKRICYEGKLGHRYYVNDLRQIIAQVSDVFAL